MSEQPNDGTVSDGTVSDGTVSEGSGPDGTASDEAGGAGATTQEFGNLSIEDDAEGTVDPADLAGTGRPGDDAVDG